jgi:hypothetical protein
VFCAPEGPVTAGSSNGPALTPQGARTGLLPDRLQPITVAS